MGRVIFCQNTCYLLTFCLKHVQQSYHGFHHGVHVSSDQFMMSVNLLRKRRQKLKYIILNKDETNVYKAFVDNAYFVSFNKCQTNNDSIFLLLLFLIISNNVLMHSVFAQYQRFLNTGIITDKIFEMKKIFWKWMTCRISANAFTGLTRVQQQIFNLNLVCLFLFTL